MDEVELNRLLGKKIKELRTKKNISQFQLGVECGFEKSNMSRIEAGRTNPTINTLFKISQALNISVMELFDFNQD